MRDPLLLPTMSNGNVRRTKSSRGNGAGRGGKGVLLAAMALPVMLITPAILYVVPGPAPADIDTVITQAHFQPVHPPSRLYGPGALYVVEGGSYWKVCNAEAELLTGKIEKSPTESQFRKVLETGGFSVAAQLVTN